MTEPEIHGSNAGNLSEKSLSQVWSRSRCSLLLNSTGRDEATDAVREWPFSRFPHDGSWSHIQSAPTYVRFIVEEKHDYTLHLRLSHVYVGLHFKHLLIEIKSRG